jgi:hypothetical protein
MKVSITGIPHFNLIFKKSTINVLMELSACHYDGTCKDAGKIGGFVYGWNNYFMNSVPCLDNKQENHEQEITGITYRQLDICLKICEQANYWYSTVDHDEEMRTKNKEKLSIVWDFMKSVDHAMSIANNLQWEHPGHE